MKLVEKRREGARQIKRYDAPKTPYRRLVENGALDEQKRAALEQQHAALNPFALKRQIEAGLKEIQRLVRAGKRSKPNLTTKVA
jgi:hypothetical protein